MIHIQKPCVYIKYITCCSVGYTGTVPRRILVGASNFANSRVTESKKHRTYQSVEYRYRGPTKQIRIPPALWSRAYRYPRYIWVGVHNISCVGYQYLKSTEFTEVSGTGIEQVPITEVSGTGDAVPNKNRYPRYCVRRYTGTRGIFGFAH